jgi:hypothetical protein
MHKIIQDKVISSLSQIEDTEGTIAVLDLLRDLNNAYVDADTLPLDRIFYAVKAVYFTRYWRLDLSNQNIDSSKHFITKCAWECMEINLAFLIKVVRDGESENIHEQNSQNNESHFRKVRSFSPIESTVVNFDARGYRKRLHKIIYEEKLMQKIPEVVFPKLERRKTKKSREKIECTEKEIEDAVARGIMAAKQKAFDLGMRDFNVDLKNYFRAPHSLKANEIMEEIEEDDLITSNEENNNHISEQDEEDEIDKTISFGEVEFLNEKSCKLIKFLRTCANLFYNFLNDITV